MESRKELIEWLIDIHNEVNVMIGKREYSYDEVYQLYNKMYSNSNSNSNSNSTITSNSTIFFIILLLLVIGYYYYINYYNK